MQTATVEKSLASDIYASWMIANGVSWCRRMSATITEATCQENKRFSSDGGGDLRCQGCNGLENHGEPPQARPMLTIVWNSGKQTDEPITDPTPLDQDAGPVNGLAALDEIINGLYENPELNDDFEDIEIDLDDEALLKLFPELLRDEDEREIEQNYANFTGYQEAVPRYSIYKGHCRQCGGYMDNTRERHDDNVYRCLACGWRTSPEYERNRTIHAAGGVMI